jgi:hypothetical protein
MRLRVVGAPDTLHRVQRQPTVLAIAGPVQWVIAPGGSPRVNVSTLLTVQIATGFLADGRASSRGRPATPVWCSPLQTPHNRTAHTGTAGHLQHNTGSRSADSKTMRGR